MFSKLSIFTFYRHIKEWKHDPKLNPQSHISSGDFSYEKAVFCLNERIKTIYNNKIKADFYCVSDFKTRILLPERQIIRFDFNKLDLWKSLVFYEYQIVKKFHGSKIVFLDPDVIILKDLTPIFKNNIDIQFGYNEKNYVSHLMRLSRLSH